MRKRIWHEEGTTQRLTDFEGQMIGLEATKLAHKVLELTHGFGLVSLLVFSVDPLGRLVQQGSHNTEIIVAQLGK